MEKRRWTRRSWGRASREVRAFTPLTADRYAIEMGVRVGAISSAYKDTLEVADKVEPTSCRMTIEDAGARTNIKGTGTIALFAGRELP